MPAPTERPTERWTAERVRAELLDETRPTPRYELVDGELLVTPSPNHDHQEAVAGIFRPLYDHVRSEGIGWAFLSPSDVGLTPDSIVQPDVYVAPLVEGRRPRGREPIRSLLLAVEVLSPSSARHDRVTKRRFFQRVGVPEYWIVDLDARVIERWRPGDERAETLDERLEWRPAGAATPFTLDVVRYFADVCDG